MDTNTYITVAFVIAVVLAAKPLTKAASQHASALTRRQLYAVLALAALPAVSLIAALTLAGPNIALWLKQLLGLPGVLALVYATNLATALLPARARSRKASE